MRDFDDLQLASPTSTRATWRCWALVAAVALGSACSIDNVTFTGEIDGGGADSADVDAGVDGSVAPLTIVVSAPSVTVGEGTTRTFTVMLSGPPPTSAGVLVSAASADDTKLGLSPAALLFSSSNWNVPHTLILSGKQDADTVDETVTVSLTSDDAPGVDVTVTVDDDDGLAMLVSPTSIDVTEGASAPLAVRLTAQPTTDVVVDVASDNRAAATITPAALTFTAANWSIDQLVTVSGVMDVNVVTDTASVALTSPALTAVAVPVQVVDKDQVSIQPSTSALALSEGGSTTVGVTLTQQPTATTTVTVASSDPGAAAAAPTSLVFTTGNWNVAQTVTINAPQDVDTASEAVSVTLAATGLTTRTVSVAVTDDDTQVIVAAPVAVAMTENGMTTVNVHLAYKPASDVVVAVTSLAGAVATVTPAQLTFSPSSYASDQALTVMAPDDADAEPGSTTLHLEAVAAGLVTDVPVMVTDDDHLTIETSAAAVTLAENGSTSFGVHLGAQPPATVMVAVLSSDIGAATAAPATLSFSTANWATAQLVTVTGVQDVDLVDEAPTLTLMATGLATKTVAATVTDDDAQGIVLSAAAVTVTEGSTGTVGVSLQYMPVGSVTVAVASADTGVATAAPATLTFTSATYDTPQLVTIGGVLDPDAVDGATTLSVTSTGLAARTVAVTVTDIDHLGLEATVPSLSVNEGATGTVGVRLTAQPAATTTVTIASNDAGAATAAPTSLSFTTANWHTYQTVTVTGVQDADAADESVTLTASSAGLASLPIPVAVIDDEILGIVTDLGAVSLTEGGTTSFQVRLAAQPPSTATVTVVSQDLGAATVAPATLMFTTASWNVYQTVTVTGVQDADLADETVTVTLASSGFPNKLVTASVNDNDSQVVVAAAGTVAVTEGASATVGVSLQFQPAANVVVSVSSADPSVATATPGSLTFTSANYAAAQTVTISGVQDADAAPNSTTLTMSATGAASASVAVNVTDDDTLGLDVNAANLAIGEAGSGTVGVRLTAQPLATTTVTMTSSDPGAATVTPSLTFTTANWNLYQNATVTGVSDPDVANESVTLTVASAGLPSKTVAVAVTDDDVLGIVTSAPTVTLGEAGTATFQVKLSAQPSANLVVSVVSGDTGGATVSAASLTFTTGNWNVNQPITVSGVADQDLADESVAITLANPLVANATVTATVTDDDTQVVLVGMGNLTVTEGGSGTFGVTLRYIPTTPTTVTVTSGAPGAASVSPATLVFDSGNYNVSRSVTVTGVQDADATNEAATVSLTAPAATSAVVAVTVVDDELLGIETSTPSVTATEGSTATFGVRLTAQPAAATTVTVTSNRAAVATAAPSALTFTTANWNAYQTVTVTGVQDLDLASETTTVTLSASGLSDRLESVNVIDDDVQIIQATGPISVTEGASGTLAVTLGFVPTSAVVVSVSTGNPAVATVSPPTLTFTAADYATPHPVTITGAQDANLTNETTTITLGGAGAGAPDKAVTVNVTDDDVQSIQAASTVAVTEGASSTLAVTLGSMPAGTVTVSVTSANPAIATASPSTLTFTAADYNTQHTVTITGAQDANLTNATTTVTLAGAGAPDKAVTVNVTDDDVQIIQAAGPISVTEGASGTLAVTLGFVPTSAVVVSVSTGNPAIATVSPPTLTFTAADYNTPHTVTITGAQDANVASETTTITLGGASAGAPDKAVTVNVTDDDVQVIQAAGPISVTEGASGTLAVTLGFVPTSAVVVSVSTSNPAIATVSPPMLTFTAVDYNTPHTVTITGAQDANVANETTTITLGGAGAGAPDKAVTVNVADDDVQRIVAPSALTVAEGASGAIGVTLAFIPTGSLTVNVTSANPLIATASPATLTFTAANYNVAQNLSVLGALDGNVVADATALSLVASGATTASVAVTVTDTRGGVWGAPQLLETDNGTAAVQQVAMNASGTALPVWEQAGSDSLYSIVGNRYVAGSGWGSAAFLEPSAGQAGDPQVAINGSGRAFAVWWQCDGACSVFPVSGRWSVWANQFANGAWGTPQLLETDDLHDGFSPQVAVDGSGNAVAVWYQSDGTRNNIWANRYVVGTGWGTAQLVETDNAGDSDHPQVGVDSAGNALAIWRQSDGARYNLWARRYVPATGWAPVQLIETDNAGDVYDPQLAVDVSGNAIAVWSQYDSAARANIWANRYVAGVGWGTAQLIETDNAGNAFVPHVAFDAAGNALAVWEQSDGTRSNIVANRFAAATGWGTAQLVETNNVGSAIFPRVAVDRSGSAVVAWTQTDGTRFNIWANRFVLATGWGSAQLLETDPGDAGSPVVAIDGVGDAVAVWQQSDGTRSNIWTARFQ